MSYASMFDLYTSDTLRGRIMMGLANTANYVLIEPAGTPNHGPRVRLAEFSLNVPDQVALMFLPAFVADPAVRSAPSESDVTDAMIDTIVAAKYDQVAARL